MTGVQLLLAFAFVIVLVGLGLLIWGKDRGTGTIKVLGIELGGSTPLLMLALGAGLVAYVVLNPSNSSPCLIFCPAPPPVIPETVIRVPVYGPTVRIASGGTSDGHSPFCQRRTVQSCAKPEHGGQLVPASGELVDVSSTGRVGSSVVVDSPTRYASSFGPQRVLARPRSAFKEGQWRQKYMTRYTKGMVTDTAQREQSAKRAVVHIEAADGSEDVAEATAAS